MPILLFAENALTWNCLLYTSDPADERPSGDLVGRSIIKKKTPDRCGMCWSNKDEQTNYKMSTMAHAIEYND